jgi:hypothetical protein
MLVQINSNWRFRLLPKGGYKTMKHKFFWAILLAATLTGSVAQAQQILQWITKNQINILFHTRGHRGISGKNILIPQVHRMACIGEIGK